MSDTIPRLNSALEGRYRIDRQVGEGGMATVYVAEDLRHERKVALKVLKPQLAAVVGADRFLAEIKTTANLQHPHILPLFDSGEADSFLFYVMPFVEGESLRDRLDRERQLPVDEAVQIARNVAEALDYAHSQGIIHRDVKPANILLQSGKPVISDFGIALAVGAAGGGRLTETGLSLGTPHYMSPEQATADVSIGPATDLYALGCVLYESLVGEPPFTGGTAQAVLGLIIAGDTPSVSSRRSTVPRNVDAAITKALAKVPADRFRNGREFAQALGDPSFGGRLTPGLADPRTRGGVQAILATTTLVFAAIAAWGWLRPSLQPVDRPVLRYTLDVPTEINMTTFGTNFALSPDGSQLAYVGEEPGGTYQLWLRERDRLVASALPGTNRAHSVFFSPDGLELAFVSSGTDRLQNGELKVTSLRGETPRTLVDGAHHIGGDWGHDGYIYFYTPDDELRRIPEGGGDIESLTRLDRESGEWGFKSAPELLPGGRGVLFAVQMHAPYDPTQVEIAVADLGTGSHKRILRGVAARATPSGDLLVVRADGSLDLVPFDEKSLEVTGSAVPVLEGVGIERWATADLFLSESGTLLYGTRGLRSEIPLQEFLWVDREGNTMPVDPDWNASFTEFSLSPDGSRLALALVEELTHDEQIWVKELDRGPATRITSMAARSRAPAWSPDGMRVNFCYCTSGAPGRGIYSARSDGGLNAPDFVASMRRTVRDIAYSPNGRWMLYVEDGDIFAMDLRGDSVPRALIGSEQFNERSPAVSPDGRWIVYVTNESGTEEVNVRSFPNVEDFRRQVSTNGGKAPMWSKDGTELFFVSGDTLRAAAITSSDQFRVQNVRPLFPLDLGPESSTFGNDQRYAVAPDGQRFLVTRPVGEQEAGPEVVVVVENFFEELKRLSPN